MDALIPKLFLANPDLPATLTLYASDDRTTTTEGRCERVGDLLRWISANGVRTDIEIADIYEDAEETIEGLAPEFGHFRIEIQQPRGSRADATSSAAPSGDTRYFTTYWSNDTWQWQRDYDDGHPLTHIAGDAFRSKDLRPGDVFYVVTVIDGALYLGGRLRAATILDQAAAEKLLGPNLWESAVHIIGDDADAQPMLYNLEISAKQARGLRLISSDEQLTRLKFAEPGRLDQQTLRSPRQLTPESAHSLDEILASAHRSRLANRSFEELRDGFLEIFPSGFRDPKYLEEERNYKVKAHDLLRSTLGPEAMEALFQSKDYEEITKRARRVLNATNLLYKSEKVSINDALGDTNSVKRFARGLFDVLHGAAAFGERFEGFASILDELGAYSWPTATYFPFLAYPGEHMFMKPQTTRAMAAACHFDLRYESDITWALYARLQELTTHLKERLADLGPRDNIDVQSFIWRAVKYE